MMTGTNRVATEIGNAIRSIVELGEQAQHHANRAQHLVAAIANADQQADGRPPDWMITFAALAKDEIENAVAMAQAIELKAYTVLVEHLDSEPPNSDGNEDI